MAEDNKRLAVVSRPERKPESTIKASDVHRQITTLTTGDMYRVQGKERPGAKIARALAVGEHISTEIIEYGKDSEKAWCKVRGWRGSRENPEMQAEAVVVHVFSQLLQQAVFDAIANGMYAPTGRRDVQGRLEKAKTVPEWEIGPDGFPRLLDKFCQFQLMNNHLDKIKFAERTTMGMAERNVILKLLGEEDDQDVDGDSGSDRASGDDNKRSSRPSAQENELDTLRGRIVAVIRRVTGGDKAKSAEEFSAITDSLKIAAKFPSELKTTDDAEKVLSEAIRRSKADAEVSGREKQPEHAQGADTDQPGHGDDPTLSANEEVVEGDDVYAPLSPEEQARLDQYGNE